MRILQALLFAGGALLPFVATAQSEIAGSVTLLRGLASAKAPGAAARTLAKGSPVYAGDAVETFGASYVLLSFTDQGSVLLRPWTRFVVEQYHLQPDAAAAPARAPAQPAAENAPESSLFRLLKGSMRAISGLIGQRDHSHYAISTPVATMGIRGTEDGLATCEADCLADPAVQEAFNTQPPGTSHEGAVVIGAYSGEIRVTSTVSGKSMDLSAGQFVLCLPNGALILLKGMPGFMDPSTMSVPPPPGEGGIAAGGNSAAQSAAAGSLLVNAAAAAPAAPVIGIVITTSGGEGTTGTTGTTQTAR